MGIVERSPNRAEHRHHAVADCLDFAPRVLGEQCPAVAEMGTPHTAHLLVPKCSAQRRRADDVGEDDGQGDAVVARPFSEGLARDVRSLGHARALAPLNLRWEATA